MEKLEGVVKVSKKGQIVIPKEAREKLKIKEGEKLALILRDDEIVLKKIDKINFSGLASGIARNLEKEKIDPEKIIAEAIEWARKRE
ncbi:MAG: AbrB/MazE/SpoVT family DNA-binding domain-containing protein [Archaeoglobaceae archaeon]